MSAIRVANDIAALSETTDEELIFDFRPLNFVRPFGIMLIAESLKIAKKKCNDKGLAITGLLPKGNNAAHSYLSHIGFYQYIGPQFGNPTNRPAGQTYVPIQEICRDALGDSKIKIQEVIKSRSEDMAQLIAPADEPSYEQLMVGYGLRETIRNVFEHANVDCCAVVAQRYRDGIVELAVADAGRGVFNSLSELSGFASVDQALEQAISPGISRVVSIDDNVWGNSGYGLYCLAETIRRCGGEFILGSSGRYLQLSEGNTLFGDLFYEGTILQVNLDTQNAEYYPNILEGIVRDGEESVYVRTGKRKRPSESSTLL